MLGIGSQHALGVLQALGLIRARSLPKIVVLEEEIAVRVKLRDVPWEERGRDRGKMRFTR